MSEGKIMIQAGLTKEILTVGQGPPVVKGNSVVVNCTGYVNDMKFWRWGNSPLHGEAREIVREGPQVLVSLVMDERYE